MIKVLIVEDEVDIRETIAEILVDEGFDVSQAENGKIGYQMFQQHNPDIIISDIMMPEVDGYGLLNMVRNSKNKLATVPFIFLTALSQKENIIKGTELSANDYLVKPIDFEILIAKINEKTKNAEKIRKDHEYGINNIKSQISSALPLELTSIIDSLSIVTQNLLNEPYGPLPHRKYLEDMSKIDKSVKRLKTAINNYLDEKVIDQKLNPYEEVLSLSKFFKSSVKSLPEKIATRVHFHEPYDSEQYPSVKIDKQILVSILKTIIASTIKSSTSSSLEISTIIDNNSRIVIIFYIRGVIDNEGFKSYIASRGLEKVVSSQNCEFDMNFSNPKSQNITITIPSFRIFN